MQQYIVDAFTDEVFKGNQAAVCVMDNWPEDKVMINIAVENNFSETAFTVKNGDCYDLRWFTPGGEIDLCGHATLATSFVIFNFYELEAQEICFNTKFSGKLYIKRIGDFYEMDFPKYEYKKIPVTEEMSDALGTNVLDAVLSRDLLMLLENEDTVSKLEPNMQKVKNLPGLCIAVTAKGTKYDSVSRVFVPGLGVPEDPVTGSTHCLITPYWCEKLGKDELDCFQASHRTGTMHTILAGDRVKLRGKAVLFAKAELYV